MTTKRKRSSGDASSSSSSTASASPSAPAPSGGLGDRFQIVEVRLPDGRLGYFMGRVLVEDEATDLRGTGVRFFQPQPLPPDCHFAPLVDLSGEEMEVTILPDGNGVVCTHRSLGRVGRFDPAHHEYAVPGDEERDLRFNRVAHADPQVLRHHWNHFVDCMGRWGLDVRSARPEYVECEPPC